MSFNVNVNLGGHGAPPSINVGLGGAPPGHHHGSGPPAIVRLSTEKMSYVGGETINGHVLMSSLYPFYAKGVFVKVEGFERCHFQEVENRTEGSGENQHTHRHVHVRKDRNEFFCKTQAVYPQEGMVQPGQFNFPSHFNYLMSFLVHTEKRVAIGITTSHLDFLERLCTTLKYALRVIVESLLKLLYLLLSQSALTRTKRPLMQRIQRHLRLSRGDWTYKYG